MLLNDSSGSSAPAWPRDELPAAIGADVSHADGARRAERALIGTNVSVACRLKRCLAPLAARAHFKGHKRVLDGAPPALECGGDRVDEPSVQSDPTEHDRGQ